MLPAAAIRSASVDVTDDAAGVGAGGSVDVQPDDSPTLSFTGIALDLPFQKYAPLARLRFERAYAREWIQRLKANRPDAVIACNLPQRGRPGTVGAFLPGLEWRLTPVEGIHDGGRLSVRGPNVMKGYLDDPAATAQATLIVG